MGKYFKKNILSNEKKEIIENHIEQDKKEIIENIINAKNNIPNTNINDENNSTHNNIVKETLEFKETEYSQIQRKNPMLFDIYEIVNSLTFEIIELKKMIIDIKKDLETLKNKNNSFEENIQINQPKNNQNTNRHINPSDTTTQQNSYHQHKTKNIPKQAIIKNEENKLEKIVNELNKKEKITKQDIEKYLNELNNSKISNKDLQEFVRKHPLEEIFPNRPKEAYKEAYKEIFNNL